MIEMKCECCPECGCTKTVKEHNNYLGEGYRVCGNCHQEWWTNIRYENHIENGRDYFVCIGYKKWLQVGKIEMERQLRLALRDNTNTCILITFRKENGFKCNWFINTHSKVNGNIVKHKTVKCNY